MPEKKPPLADAKNCPFCGGHNLGVPPQPVAQVVCQGCGATGPMVRSFSGNPAMTQGLAEDKWNKRQPPS